MFVLGSLLKIVGVIVALILVGLILMPTDLLFLGMGAVTIVTGIVYLFAELWTGLMVAAIGAVLVLTGVWVRRTEEREREESIARAQTAATRVSRSMDVYLPPD